MLSIPKGLVLFELLYHWGLVEMTYNFFSSACWGYHNTSETLALFSPTCSRNKFVPTAMRFAANVFVNCLRDLTKLVWGRMAFPDRALMCRVWLVDLAWEHCCWSARSISVTRLLPPAGASENTNGRMQQKRDARWLRWRLNL